MYQVFSLGSSDDDSDMPMSEGDYIAALAQRVLNQEKQQELLQNQVHCNPREDISRII